MSDTPTPLTDAAEFDRDEDCSIEDNLIVTADFARSLERQIPRWLPIDSVPRDGTKILLRGRFSIADQESVEIGRFDFEHKGECVFIVGVTRFHATHWMPLPEPPTL